MFIGVDWAQETMLQYVILNDDGYKIKEGSFERSLDGIDQLTEAIEDIETDFGKVRVGIDRKYDMVCQNLFAKGLQVFPLSPSRTKAERHAYHPAGDKGDGIDASLHANIVRKDWKHLQPYQPQEETDVVLRELLKARNSLVDKKKRAKQELKSLLSAYSPLLGNLVGDLSRKWQKELLKRWPLDQDFLGAHGNELNAFLKQNRLMSSTEEKVRNTKDSRSIEHSEEVADCYRMMIKQTVELIEKFEVEISRLDGKISARTRRHRSFEMFSSLPTESDPTVAAFCIAFEREVQKPWSWENHSAFMGLSPVTRASGKSKTVHMRRAYDRTLHKAFMDFADSTRRREDCWAYQYYKEKRAAGKGHYETLRQIGKKWVKIMHAMWRNRTKYDENYISIRHRQRQKLAA